MTRTPPGSIPRQREPHPLTVPDLVRLGGLAALAAVLLAPGRHYIGPLERVSAAKISEDSFPLSTYPMFSEDRRGRITIPHVVGFTADGRRLMPHYSHYGAGGLNQVRKQVSAAVRDGRAVEVAQQFADSLAAARESSGSTTASAALPSQQRCAAEAQIIRVAVVRSRFRFDDWFDGDRAPHSEALFAQCAVGGRASSGPGGALRRTRRAAAPGPGTSTSARAGRTA